MVYLSLFAIMMTFFSDGSFYEKHAMRACFSLRCMRSVINRCQNVHASIDSLFYQINPSLTLSDMGGPRARTN